jgi:hypothetical protein
MTFSTSRIWRYILTGASGGCAALLIGSFMPIWKIWFIGEWEATVELHSFWFVVRVVSRTKSGSPAMDLDDLILALIVFCTSCLVAIIVRAIVRNYRSTQC